eukprot:1097272-Rhodomonas_salina.2
MHIETSLSAWSKGESGFEICSTPRRKQMHARQSLTNLILQIFCDGVGGASICHKFCLVSCSVMHTSVAQQKEVHQSGNRLFDGLLDDLYPPKAISGMALAPHKRAPPTNGASRHVPEKEPQREPESETGRTDRESTTTRGGCHDVTHALLAIVLWGSANSYALTCGPSSLDILQDSCEAASPSRESIRRC